MVQVNQLGKAEELVNLVTRMFGALVELGLDHVWFISELSQHARAPDCQQLERRPKLLLDSSSHRCQQGG
jgi:hypothetical protein